MMKVQTKIYRYGVSRVESALASDAPDPVPRKDPTPTTSRTVPRKCGARLSKRTVKPTTGQNLVQKMFQDLAERELSPQNNVKYMTP